MKRDDFLQGVAQNAMQIKSALPRRKRKADKVDPRVRCFPIEKHGRFLECTRGIA